MIEPFEPKEIRLPLRCPNCGGTHFSKTIGGQIICASVSAFIAYETEREGCGWRGALHEPQMEIVKCL